ncbi:MAG TPA: hypothetical protein VLH83_06405 [Chthoniobacterales bacterium]|nr:hypothetical protein [Chthoniobacterales bacterium]
MKIPTTLLRFSISIIVTLLLSGLVAHGADSPGWAGEYRDDKFLGGRAVFQLTIDQSGGATHVTFDAAWNDAHGAAPEADGPATVSGNTLTFKFKDSFDNSGTGTITRAGNDILLSINPIHVVEPRCLGFYGKNMRLKRVGKK